ncbi:fasciclin domain-containing protein [Carboxylicivirga sp. RSCT41]|uniref:fasciclin domain-containing protein n=1 Tax=Carboxylicivirga agarovorans TaxID=3417570 RepID=UPI003D340682
MKATLAKIYGITEALMLLITGLFALGLSLSDNYGLLMNENFRWLTFAGALLLIIAGLVLLVKPPEKKGSNLVFFGLLFLLVVIGKPFLPNSDMPDPSASFMQAGLWDQIDQTRFPKEELSNLSTLGADMVYTSGSSFTTVGVVKRLDELDEQQSFALMSTFMYCCVADMFGTGFRVPADNFDKLEDGQMVMISGKLEKEQLPVDLPNFRFGRALISSTNKDYYLKAEHIMTYNRLDQLPLLSELITEGERIERFRAALERASLLDKLASDEPFTIFIPVDKALEDLDVPFEKMSKRELKKFLKTHMVKGKLLSRDLMQYDQIESLSGMELKIDFKHAKNTVNTSRVLFKDTEAQNGVLHFIYPALTASE